MPYQTGIASSPANLIDLLSSFLTTNGWVQDAAAGSGDDIDRYLNDGADFFISIRTTASQIRWWPNQGYSGAAAIDDQPGKPQPWGSSNGRTALMDGPYTGYHFFLDQTSPDGDRLHMVVEQQAGLFRICSFGTVKKSGIWDGGNYCTFDQVNSITGSGSRLSVYTAFTNSLQFSTTDRNCILVGGIDGFPNKEWLGHGSGVLGHNSIGGSAMLFNSEIGNAGPGAHILGGSVTMRASYSNFWPLREMQIWIRRPLGVSTALGASIAGHIPNVYSVNTNELSPKEIVTIGSDDFIVFPNGRKAANNTVNSAHPNAGLNGLMFNRSI